LLDFHRQFITPPDRIEAGSLAILSTLLAKNVLIKNFNLEESAVLIDQLKKNGRKF